jgi:CP family cyanate transporter-like MFS transporter
MNNREAIRKSFPIFITAINMRTGLAIMSPLIPILKDEYQLSSFALSFLTSLSIVCFAGSAFLMPLVARIGSTNQVIGAALLVLTAAMIIRAAGNVPLLYFSSLTIGITIAILNFSLPVWVKENVSGHSGLITGIYITLMGGFANIAIASDSTASNCNFMGMAAFNGAVDCDWNLFISLVVFTQCQNANSDSHS